MRTTGVFILHAEPTTVALLGNTGGARGAARTLHRTKARPGYS